MHTNVSKVLDIIVAPVILMCLFVNIAMAKRLPPIYWNSTNPIFAENAGNRMIRVMIRDQVDLICPFYETGSTTALLEYLEIYMVSRWSYDNCQLTDNRKIVGICKTPWEPGVSITVVFRAFTPKPNGLEFRPDHRYYFITTSDGTLDGLRNREGGLCRNKHMKFAIDVISDNEKSNPSMQQSGEPSRSSGKALRPNRLIPRLIPSGHQQIIEPTDSGEDSYWFHPTEYTSGSRLLRRKQEAAAPDVLIVAKDGTEGGASSEVIGKGGGLQNHHGAYIISEEYYPNRGKLGNQRSSTGSRLQIQFNIHTPSTGLFCLLFSMLAFCIGQILH